MRSAKKKKQEDFRLNPGGALEGLSKVKQGKEAP